MQIELIKILGKAAAKELNKARYSFEYTIIRNRENLKIEYKNEKSHIAKIKKFITLIKYDYKYYNNIESKPRYYDRVNDMIRKCPIW